MNAGDNNRESEHFKLPDLDTSRARVPVRTTQSLGGDGQNQHRADDADPQNLREASRWAWWTFALGTGAVVGGIALGATPLLLVAPPVAALALRAGLHAQARRQPPPSTADPHGVSPRAQALLARTQQVQADLEVSGLEESIRAELVRSLDQVPERVQTLQENTTRLEHALKDAGTAMDPSLRVALTSELSQTQAAMEALEASVEGIHLGLSQIGQEAPTPGVESQLRKQADALQATALQMRQSPDQDGGDNA